MGINVRVEECRDAKEIPSFTARLERDLRSCMKCRFFYGHNSQCVASECVKEAKLKEQEESKDSLCYECPYKQSEQYCFPCMRKLLGLDRKEQNEEIANMEEKEDG